MTRQRTPPRLVPATLLVSAALLGCNQRSTSPPADRLDALVLGPVQSPYLDALRPSLNLVQYTGSQKMADYDVLVFDGDAHAPQALRDGALVEQALRAGKWVLGLDVSEDHKRTGFSARLGLVNRSTSPGWLVRMGRGEGGQPAVWVVDAPKVQALLTATPLPGKVVADPAAQLSASTGAYAGTVMSRLRAPLTEVRGTPIPPNLIMKTYHYAGMTGHHLAGTYKTGGQQTTRAEYDFTLNVYLDNPDFRQEQFQWVAVDADVTSNPTSGTGNLANMSLIEKAWFLDRQMVSIRPSADDDALFTLVGSSPATTSGVSQVTTDTSFTVGFSSNGPTKSYTYSNPQTRPLEDWKLSNQSSGNALSWYYRAASPIDADDNYHFPSSAWSVVPGTEEGLPKQPNDLSLTQLQAHTQGVWKTRSLLNKTVTFEVESFQGLADLFCPGDLFSGTCDHSSDEDPDDNLRINVARVDVLEIDMASVVAIPISSLTFDPKTVTAGSPLTGTITLASPAVEDTDITLFSSDARHAAVPPEVTVKQGQTSATFQVTTDAGGAAPGSVLNSDIGAFYGGSYASPVQLTITVPK